MCNLDPPGWTGPGQGNASTKGIIRPAQNDSDVATTFQVLSVTFTALRQECGCHTSWAYFRWKNPPAQRNWWAAGCFHHQGEEMDHFPAQEEIGFSV